MLSFQQVHVQIQEVSLNLPPVDFCDFALRGYLLGLGYRLTLPVGALCATHRSTRAILLLITGRIRLSKPKRLRRPKRR